MQKHLGYALRKGRYSSTNNIYLITTVTHQREPIFSQLSFARMAINALYHHDRQKRITTFAYVLMPDHLHWLFQLHNETLSRIMRDFKGYSSRQISKHTEQNGKIWQAGYHDHALRRDEDIQKVARYIVANPLRAGLVDQIGMYPHWDTVWI